MSSKVTLRDNRNKGWSWFNDEFISEDVSGELGAYAVTVYVIIAKHADKNQGAFPGYDLIAKLGKMSRRQAIRCVASLEERKIITVTRKKNPKTGHNKANHYDLTHPSVWVNPSDSDDVNQVTGLHLVGDSESPELESVELESKNNSAKAPRKKSSKSKDDDPFTSKNPDPFQHNVLFILYGYKRGDDGFYRQSKDGELLTVKAGRGLFGHIGTWIKEWKNYNFDLENYRDYHQLFREKYPDTEYAKSGDKAARWWIANRQQAATPALHMMPEIESSGMSDKERLAILDKFKGGE